MSLFQVRYNLRPTSTSIAKCRWLWLILVLLRNSALFVQSTILLAHLLAWKQRLMAWSFPLRLTGPLRRRTSPTKPPSASERLTREHSWLASVGEQSSTSTAAWATLGAEDMNMPNGKNRVNDQSICSLMCHCLPHQYQTIQRCHRAIRRIQKPAQISYEYCTDPDGGPWGLQQYTPLHIVNINYAFTRD